MLSKILIVMGVLLTLIGIFMHFQWTIPYLGKLPGDIYYKGDHVYFYFPITTSIVLSIILSLVFYFLFK